jgi:hypothetical protein
MWTLASRNYRYAPFAIKSTRSNKSKPFRLLTVLSLPVRGSSSNFHARDARTVLLSESQQRFTLMHLSSRNFGDSSCDLDSQQ